MFPTSSSASSPVSSRSTIASSPETAGGSSSEPSKPDGHLAFSRGSGQGLMQGMQAMLSGFANGGSYPMFTAPDFTKSVSPSVPPVQTSVSVSPGFAPRLLLSGRTSSNDSPHLAGSRAEPPKRTMDVEALPVVITPLMELVHTRSTTKLLLQGDPQSINKQRVETAIRVILDLLRLIPLSIAHHPIHPSLLPAIPRGPTGDFLAGLERVGTFRALRLQAGTTTKANSKKQMSAGPIPRDQMLYLETAVYMSGEHGKRVYVCKRCRMREARRKQSKDANRKKHSASESEASSKAPRQSSSSPSIDNVTGENPDQYDTHRESQVVEEPPWDPLASDWRHEIVLFNSPPEVTIKDGSCMWLPFRVVCYGKCHGEKTGFRIKFTLRSSDGHIIAVAMTEPIRITDDHKTDMSKIKPRVDGMSSMTRPPTAKVRKGRASAASSRRQSPAPSEGESVHSTSVAGAVFSKQTPNARANKPYERPPGMSGPADSSPTTSPNFRRQSASTSVASMSALLGLREPANSLAQTVAEHPSLTQHVHGTVSPRVLRQPAFDLSFTPLDGRSNVSLPQSATSSNVASPVGQMRRLNGEYGTIQSPNDLMSVLLPSLEHQRQLQQQTPMISGINNEQVDFQMTSAMNATFDNMFSMSSGVSVASSFDGGSGFDDASGLFSDSGLVPESMEGFLDFSGGEDQDLNQPFFQSPVPPVLSPRTQMAQDDQINQFLNSLTQSSAPPPQPVPTISTVIPAEGPMAGGDTVAIIGENFVAETTIIFGDRIAKPDRVTPTFIQVRAPPAISPGVVQVTVQGYAVPGHLMPNVYKYNMMDADLMRLALEVRDQYQGSLSDAAYRLAQHVARSQSNSEWSESSPSNGKPSPVDAGPSKPTEDDLQLTVIKFLALIDEDAPGSLRRSGAVNRRNKAQQTLLHIATAMGFQRLVRRLVVIGAHLDVQDVNGYTPLALASFSGQVACARVLIEAGAAYDRPTAFGEMPLDLAKVAERKDVEALLLSAVWSTQPGAAPPASIASIDTSSEIDDDNPSSGSEDGIAMARRKNIRLRGKQRATPSPPRGDLIEPTMLPATVTEIPHDEPPPYEAPISEASWVSRTISHIPHSPLLPEAVRLPIQSLFNPDKSMDHGWVAFPAPSWDMLQKVTSPEEVKLFTQAMAAAAFNAVIQSGATTSLDAEDERQPRSRQRKQKSRRGSRSETASPSQHIVKHVKRDTMLYLFWLPILLFVGFWLMVTALPIAMMVCLIYARQITRAIMQRL